MRFVRRIPVSGLLYRFVPLVGALVAIGSCQRDQRSVTGVPPASGPAAAVTVADEIPPPTPGSPQITLSSTDASGATYSTTWTASVDQPSGQPVGLYHLTYGFNDGSWGNASTAPTNSAQVRFPYHASGQAATGWFCVRAEDAAGNQSVDQACNSLTVPAQSSPPPSGGVVFESNWSTALGTSDAAIRDGGRWDAASDAGNNPGAGGPIMEVVSGGPPGYANALRIQQRGGCDDCWANVREDEFIPQSTDYYVRYYMRNDDTSPAGDHVVTVDFLKYQNLTYMRKERHHSGPNEWEMLMSHHAFLDPTSGCSASNYPFNHSGPWQGEDGVVTPPKLIRGQWYRFEYHVDFISATRMQVHPRVYDASGTLLFDDDDFRQSDYNPTKPGNTGTLASYYAAGNSFCVNPTAMDEFDMGNNAQAGAINTGLYWYYAGVQIRTDRWPDP